MPEPIVRIQDVSRDFDKRRVLKDLNFEVHGGEVVGLLGPNGGGKSTLLSMMAGLLAPTRGRVTVYGRPAQRVAVESAGLVGLVLARPGLYPLLTGWENLTYFGGLFGFSADEVRAKAKDALASFELTDRMETRTNTWSTGMQQKLSLVRALLSSPKLLLFDEPTANLDPLAARTLYRELRQRADDGLACVLVTHHIEAAESICDRVLFVDGAIKRELELSNRTALPGGELLNLWEKEAV